MPSNSYPIIAKEGWVILGILLAVLFVAHYYLGNTATISTVVLIFVAAFLLRDPTQIIPSLPLAVVSPASGKVLSIEEVDDPWIPRRASQIRIRVSILDIYSLRSPVEGKILNHWTRCPDTTNKKRRFAFRIRSDEGDEIVTVINLNLLGPLCFRFYAHSGERLGHGQRCGYLYFGGTIDVLVPQNSKVKVKPGDKVTSGSGILSQLVHSDTTASLVNAEQAAID